MTQRNRNKLTDAEVLKKINDRSPKYWAKRSELRQIQIESLIGGHEDLIRKAHDEALSAINQDISSLIDEFQRQTGLKTGFTFTQEQARDFLEGKLSNQELSRLRRQWATRGEDLDEVLRRNQYRIDELTRKKAIRTSIDERMNTQAIKEVQLSNIAYADAVKTIQSLHRFDLSVRTGFDLGHQMYSARDVNAILSMNWSGHHYSSRIWNNSNVLGQQLKSLFLQKELTGASTRDIINQLASVTEAGKYASARLIRTEANAMRTTVEKTEAEELGIDQYIIIATLDNKTSSICQEMDNKVFEWSKSEIGVNAPPFHPNCRTIASDYLPEFMDLSKMKRVARNPKTGETEYIPANISYKEWADSHGINNDKPKATKTTAVKEKAPTIVTPDNDIPTIRSRGFEKIENTNFSKAYGDDTIGAFKNQFENVSDPRVLKLYDEFGSDLSFSKGQKSYFTPINNSVTLNNQAFTGVKGRSGMVTVHHEMGHAFDALGTKAVDGKYYRVEGTKTVKRKLGRQTFVSEVEDRKYFISSKPEYDLKATIKRDLWEYVNGDLPTMSSLGKRPRKQAEYQEWLEKAEHIRTTAKTNFDTFKETVKSSSNVDFIGAVSDITEGTKLFGEDFPMGWGHGSRYWNDAETLETEFFAHMTELRASNPEASKQFEAIFKNSSKVWERIIDDILKAKGAI